MKLAAVDLMNVWNVNRGEMLQCSTLDVKNRKHLAGLRMEQVPDLQRWAAAIKRAAKSRFCTGKLEARDGGNPFVANFDWILRPEVLVQIEEGQYDDRVKEFVAPDSPSPQKDPSYWGLPKTKFTLPHAKVIARAAAVIGDLEHATRRHATGAEQQRIIEEEVEKWNAENARVVTPIRLVPPANDGARAATPISNGTGETSTVLDLFLDGKPQEEFHGEPTKCAGRNGPSTSSSPTQELDTDSTGAAYRDEVELDDYLEEVE